ncbi:MAG: alpha/beta fold hydrolase [Allomuricauda sp.]
MKSFVGYSIALMMIMVLPSACFAQEAELRLEPKEVRSEDGTVFKGVWGELLVPEMYSGDSSKKIMVPFFKLDARAKSGELPPIFILPGGPGDSPSALEQLQGILPLLSDINERNDLIIIGQRGNGLSRPNLLCDGFIKLPLDRPLTPEVFSEAYIKYVMECSNSMVEKGVNLKAYHVDAMVDDVDAVRKALGYDKIMLFGGSFGSHHALAYMNKYRDCVDRVILDSPEGLNHTTKLPITGDNMLMKLDALVDQDASLSSEIPSFLDLVSQVLFTLDKSPIEVSLDNVDSNRNVSIVVGKYDLQLVTALVLGRRGYRELPYRYLEMKKGNYDWLAQIAYQIRNFQNRNLMAVLTDCSSKGSPERFELVRNQAKRTFLGDTLNNINFEACGLLPVPSTLVNLEDSRSDIPLMIIVGSQDARTPPENAGEIKNLHSNAKILHVEYASHDLFNEAYDLLEPWIKGFFEAENPIEYQLPEKIVAPLDLRKI